MSGERRVHLLLLRHAQSENNRDGADDSREPVDEQASAARQADPPLSDLGFNQSETCASWIAAHFGPRVAHIHVSPMVRAIQTASPLARALPHIPTSLHLDAFEAGGIFDGARADGGRGHAAVHGLGRAQMLSMLGSMAVPLGSVSDPPGGWWRGGFEPDAETRARAARVCEWAWAQATATRGDDGQPPVVVLVTHGLFMSHVLQQLLGAAVGDGGPSVSFLSANGAVWLLELRVRSDGPSKPARGVGILGAGRTDHIPPEQRSGQRLDGFCIPACME